MSSKVKVIEGTDTEFGVKISDKCYFIMII